LTTAPPTDLVAQTFQVIHPFHPWHGRRFELVEYKNAWGEDRVYFHNEEQQLIALPASWTDVVAAMGTTWEQLHPNTNQNQLSARV
jgi:hypothetical protein